jgi:hypothetical protein
MRSRPLKYPTRDCVECVAIQSVAAEHELLSLVRAPFHPIRGTLAGAVLVPCAFRNDAFELMLSHRSYQIRKRHIEGFRITDCVRQSPDNTTKLFAAVVEAPSPHILAPQHEQVECVEHYCTDVAEALKQIERRLAAFVERHNLAVYDSVAREFRDALHYPWKPAGEILLIA